MHFSLSQHQVWQTLFDRQIQLLDKHGSSLFWDGFERIQFSPNRVPSIKSLNRKLQPATGWQTTRTSIRYSTADQWYPQFARRRFPVTTYIRTMDELDFTPEPDVFHDTFGHLAFFMLPEFTAFAELFAPAYLQAQDPEIKANIQRLAWFSYEFGVLIEQGKPKAFGAGLVSSFGELTKVVTGHTQLVPFSIENVLAKNKAVYSMHDTLFFFESLEEVKATINSYLTSVSSAIESKER